MLLFLCAAYVIYKRIIRMANITFNGLASPSLLTFSDIPNIVKVSENFTGSKAQITLSVLGGSVATATGNSQYYITLLDETIENVIDYANLAGRRFYISDPVSTAASIAIALRNCGSILSEWDITYSQSNVYLVSKTFGSKLNRSVILSTNLPSSVFSYGYTDGVQSSDMLGGKVIIKVFNGAKEVTDLTKSWYDDSVSFDISPVLQTFMTYGIGQEYSLQIDGISNTGRYTSLGSLGGQIATYGYYANDSDKFLSISNRILMNDKGYHYTYSNIIPITVMSPNNSASASWTAYTSNMVQLSNGASPASPVNGYFADINITVPTNVFSDAYYVDVHYGGDTIRFNVIKPLKAAEGYVRVYWRNEYGGVSFYDFTGAITEGINSDVETYNQNIYGLYDGSYEGKRIYQNETRMTHTVTTHLMKKGGELFAYSLMKSKKMWVRENSKDKVIIPSSIEITELEGQNNIYQVRFSYEYGENL